MNHMECIQRHIDVTRQQIIRQLQDEISQYQQELGGMQAPRHGESDKWGYRVYQSIIEHKQDLIARLSLSSAI